MSILSRRVCCVVTLISLTLFVGSVSIAADHTDAEHAHDASAAQKSGGASPSMEMHMSMMKGMKDMQGMKPTGDMDYDFAQMMRHHHAHGIQMAEQELKHGKDQKMRELAQRIVDTQKREVAEFDVWLKTNQKPAATRMK